MADRTVLQSVETKPAGEDVRRDLRQCVADSNLDGSIALLVLKYLQLKARFGWSLSNLVALLRMNLLVYRDLWTWLDAPFTAPPPLQDPVQGALTFG